MPVLICRFPLPLGVWEGLRFVIVALPRLFLPFFHFIDVIQNMRPRYCSINQFLSIFQAKNTYQQQGNHVVSFVCDLAVFYHYHHRRIPRSQGICLQAHQGSLYFTKKKNNNKKQLYLARYGQIQQTTNIYFSYFFTENRI